MSRLYSVLVCLLATVFLYLRSRIQRSRQHKSDHVLGQQHDCLPPPRLQNQRPFGVDRLEQIFRADAESRLMELFLFHFRQTGYTLEQVFLGTQAFGTVDPENLEAMLSTSAKDWSFGPRRDITFPMFGDGIFTQEGAAWKHSREMLRPQFHHRQYEHLSIFRDSVDDLLDAIPSNGGVVDLQPLFFRLTLDTTTEFLFGESVKSLKQPQTIGEETFADAFNTAQEYIIKRFRLLDLYWLIGGKGFREACDRVHQFADRIIDRNLSEDGQPEDEKKYLFLRTVAESSKDRAALRGQIVNILVAGRDTTACLLSWTFFLLVRHPDVLEKLREEIAKNGVIEHRNDLRKLSYLQNILKETLRLYPPVPVNTRTALRTTVLPTGGGPDRKSPVLIPKGSAVAYSVYTMHRRPDLYGLDAEIFRPERWDDQGLPLYQDETWAKWGWLPFNGGPRICLGMDFAMTEAAYTVVRIIQRFNTIKLPVNEAVELIGVEKQRVTLVLSIADGCNVELC